MAKRKVLTERLPQTPCTPEMKDGVLAIAEYEGRSVADVQRDAIALFLKKFGKKLTGHGIRNSGVQPS